MKSILKAILSVFAISVLVVSIFFAISYLVFNFMGPDYKHGNYTMTYKVYYPENPKTYTISNEWPISMTSQRGTNRIKKTIHRGPFEKCYGSETVIETSAPIEVVSYTYKEK